MKSIFITKSNGEIKNIESIQGKIKLALDTAKNGTYNLILKRTYEKRSLDQNSLLWLWMSCIERETGQNKDDIKDYYCTVFLSRTAIINGKEVTVTGGTSKLNTVQFAEFLNKVQADAAAELGITLPNPEDKHFEDFYNEYKQSLNY